MIIKALPAVVLLKANALADTDAKIEAMDAMLSVEFGNAQNMKAIMGNVLAKNSKLGCCEVVVKEADATVTNKICIKKKDEWHCSCCTWPHCDVAHG